MAVPQEALWMALAKLGVPDETVQLIKSRLPSGHKVKDPYGLEACRMGSEKDAARLLESIVVQPIATPVKLWRNG